MDERVWIAMVMIAGAVAEAAGVGVIAGELRSTRQRIEKFNIDMHFVEQSEALGQPAAGRDLLRAMGELLVATAAGGLRLRWVGVASLLVGIALTLAANIWAFLGLR